MPSQMVPSIPSFLFPRLSRWHPTATVGTLTTSLTEAFPSHDVQYREHQRTHQESSKVTKPPGSAGHLCFGRPRPVFFPPMALQHPAETPFLSDGRRTIEELNFRGTGICPQMNLGEQHKIQRDTGHCSAATRPDIT